jgi:transcriptional regulator with XRE-family HTH domain
MDIYAQLGKRIIYLRKKRKMSQLQLSVESEINKNYISDLERGKRNPSLMILNRIAIALKIDMSELLKGIQDFSYEDIVLKMSSIR